MGLLQLQNYKNIWFPIGLQESISLRYFYEMHSMSGLVYEF